MDTSKIDTDPLEYATKYYWRMSYSAFLSMLIADLVLVA